MATPPHNPGSGYRLTSDFGFRVRNGKLEYHPGIDWGADLGTPVSAAGDGKVILQRRITADMGIPLFLSILIVKVVLF